MRVSLRVLQQSLSVVGCANGIGGHQLGCESAVQILKNSDILHKCRIPLKWEALINEVNTGRHMAALPGVIQTMNHLARHTSDALLNSGDCLVIGGDHSSAIGTWSGVATAKRQQGDIGLIWVDAHLDAHTPETSPSGNIHGMPVAHLLGFGDRNLAEIGDNLPKIRPENLCFVGIRSYEKGEQELLERLGVRIFYMDEVDRRGITEVMQEAQYHVSRRTVGYGMTIDIDGFCVEDAPAVGTPADGGIRTDEFLQSIIRMDMRNLIATEIVEFLPRFDDQNRTSEKLVVNLIETIYLTKFFQNSQTENIFQRRMDGMDDCLKKTLSL